MTRTQVWSLLLGLVLLAAVLPLFAEPKKSEPKNSADAGWLTSFDQALAQAKAEKKVVLADFTGSDWCGWCIKLKKEVFASAEFQKFAGEKLVLLELDYPRNKPQSDALKKQNAELQKKFNVDGFPTIVFLDGAGKELGRITGYLPKDQFLTQAQEFVAKAKN